MKYIIILLLITGCAQKLSEADIYKYRMPLKYCIHACMKSSFRMFHNSSSFSGSSSMDGIQQIGIYKILEDKCKEFYLGEQCCKSNVDYPSTLKTLIHSGFGVCAKGE